MATELDKEQVSPLTREQVLHYREVFTRYGKENGGKISPKDLGTVMRFLGKNPSEAELRLMGEKVGADESGKIEFHEFLSMMQSSKDYRDCENEIVEAFRVFDKDGSGLVSTKELKDILTSLGEKLTEEEVDDLFNEGGADHNGLINYQEICRAVLQ